MTDDSNGDKISERSWDVIQLPKKKNYTQEDIKNIYESWVKKYNNKEETINYEIRELNEDYK